MMRHPALFSLTAVVALLPACADDNSDLPPGWDGAVAVGPNYFGPYGGMPEEDPLVAAGVSGGEIRVVYEHGVFIPGPGYKVWVKEVGDGWDALIQLADMSQEGTSTPYQRTVRFVAGPGAVGDRVRIFRRPEPDGDKHTEPFLDAEVVVEGNQGDCDTLAACGVDDPCAEMYDPDEIETHGCHNLSVCGDSRCSWDREACWLECADTDCGFQGSEPTTPVCP